MKLTSSTLAVVAALAFSSSAFAFTPKEAAPTLASPTVKLVPSKIVPPSQLPETFTRSVLNVEFSLDAAGRPRDVKVLTNAELAVKDQVVKAFRQWRFEDAARDAANTGKRFVLPLEISPEA